MVFVYWGAGGGGIEVCECVLRAGSGERADDTVPGFKSVNRWPSRENTAMCGNLATCC